MTYSNYYPERDVYCAAAYLRLSREDGDKLESDSIDSQRSIIRQYASNNSNIKLVGEYKDDGYTGTNFNRPGFQRMIDDIENGTIDCVIVKDLSRFGRDYIDGGNYLERYFPDKNIRFIAINDGVDSFTSGYDDIYMPIKNFFNAQYPKDISRKVHCSIKAKQNNGEFIGAFASYGYVKSSKDRHKLIIDEYAASVVRRIFNMYSEGCGKIRIAKILNEEGILSPTEYKQSRGMKYTNSRLLKTTHYWTYSTIHKILKNEMYIGNMVQSKTIQHMHGKAKKLPREKWIVVEGTHEPIISRDLWNNVQRLLQTSTKNLNFNESVNVFAGFLKCADCGRSMSKTVWKNPDGTIRNVLFNCGSYKRYGKTICSSHATNQKYIMQVLLTVMNDSIAKIKDIQSIWESTKGKSQINYKAIDAQIEMTNNELEKTKAKKIALYDDFKEDLISKEEYLSLRKKYADKEAQLIGQIALLTNEKKPEDGKECVSPTVLKLLNYEKIREEDIDRNFMATFVDEIVIHEGLKLDIKLKFFIPEICAN